MKETTPEWEERFDEFRHNVPVKLVDYEGNWNDVTPALKSFIRKEKTASYHEALEDVKEWAEKEWDVEEGTRIGALDELILFIEDLKK